MRILWFTNTPSNYMRGINAHNGGGWISSLENEIKKRNDVDLGIAFHMNGQPRKSTHDGVCYYPIRHPFDSSIKGKIRRLLTTSKSQLEYYISEYIRVVEDYAPDIIHIFGTEQTFGLLSKYINVPIVIHIQGLLAPCNNAFFPPGYNKMDYVWYNNNIWSACNRWFFYESFKKKVCVEKQIMCSNKHFIGRTKWDKKLISLYSPSATYDYCSEVLRESFYLSYERKLPDKLIVTTTISSPLYKGFDIVLKCAKILKFQMRIDFEWRVFGDVNPCLHERKNKVNSSTVNVLLFGIADQESIIKSICSSTLYVHPSYIDNSPNSVCESQILGCTVIGQNVGGMSTLIDDGKTGFLVPANDPYQMACAIRDLYFNPQLNISMGNMSAVVARARHNKTQIVSDLMAIYQKYKI